MNVNLLAISVGNTRTRLGTFVDGQLVSSAALENDQPDVLMHKIREAWDQLRDQTGAGVLVASVNPAVTQKLMRDLEHELPGARVLRAERDVPIPIGRQVDAQTLIGEDRLLNAAGAYDRLKQACVVIDAGTAITVDFVDGSGTLHGGAIAPGAQLMLDAMHQRTAQLPQVEMDKPEEPIGHNTVQAMRCGVFYGLRGLVHELIEQYAEVAGAFPMVVATGGNAELLFKDYELVERIVPDLTLWGLAVAWQKETEQDSDE